MEFFMLLSIAVLLSGIPVIYFVKECYAKLIRTIFWVIGLTSLIVISTNVVFTANPLLGSTEIYIFGQRVMFSLNTISVYFMFVIAVAGIIYSIYDFKFKELNSDNSTKGCILSTFVLALTCLSLMMENGLIYCLVFILNSLCCYKLINSKKENFVTSNNSRFMVLQYISFFCFAISLMLILSISNSFEFSMYNSILSGKPLISNTMWLLIFSGFIFQILSSYTYRINFKENLYKLPELSVFLPIMIKIFSYGFLVKYIYFSALASRVWAEWSALIVSVLIIISEIVYKKSKNADFKLLLVDFNSTLLELIVLFFAMTGVAYNIPLLAIVSFIVLFVLILNGIISLFIIGVSKSDENKNFPVIYISGILSYMNLLPFCGFFAILSMLVTIGFVIHAKIWNPVLLTSFVLLICYTIMNTINLSEHVKFVRKNNQNSENVTSYGLKTILRGGSILVVPVLAGIFINSTIRFAIVPVSTFISGKNYIDIYSSIINCFELLQNLIYILLVLIAVFFVIKHFIIPKLNLPCLKK